MDPKYNHKMVTLMLKLHRLFEVCMKKLSDKVCKSTNSKSDLSEPTIELRIDDKGFIYSKHRQDKLPIDDEEFAQFCQMLGCIALMEMKDNNRILH